MYTEYKVITDYSLEHIQSTVNTYMKEQWQPIGGISIVLYVNNPDEFKKEGFDTAMYAQALAR